MKKNQFVTGVTIFMCLAILTTGGCTPFAAKKSAAEQSNEPVIDLTYCDVNVPSKLCVASFGTENENKTLVNFITSDPSFPDFNLKIQRNGIQSDYECQKVKNFPSSIYCVGENIALGETIELEVFSKADEFLIAKGSLNISFLAISTPITVGTLTTPSSLQLTPSTVQATPSQTPIPQVTASATESVQATPVPTGTPVDSYPNYP